MYKVASRWPHQQSVKVEWNLGKRCNYDCSYCPVHRHDNFSPHASLEELKKNADFVFKYISLYMKYRHYKEASISFTGGEPTVNPNFIPFIKYLNEKYQADYKSRFNCTFALTSNGAMSEKMADAIVENFSHITISYHTEADDTLKKQALDRIEQIYTKGPTKHCTVSINVMFHAQYFDECIEVTPNFIRMRKLILDETERNRLAKQMRAEAE